jgi:hypothetical protein
MESFFALMSHLILFLSLTTLAFATGAYVALVLRRRQPVQRRRECGPGSEAALLRRYSGDEHE